ncbi:hypothetical protein BC628DRAFT_1401338 [Trametes gibbosa]|nr:hypothetical protein BC628DRAFT_1401338 [Trametes gibbosa]
MTPILYPAKIDDGGGGGGRAVSRHWHSVGTRGVRPWVGPWREELPRESWLPCTRALSPQHGHSASPGSASSCPRCGPRTASERVSSPRILVHALTPSYGSARDTPPVRPLSSRTDVDGVGALGRGRGSHRRCGSGQCTPVLPPGQALGSCLVTPAAASQGCTQTIANACGGYSQVAGPPYRRGHRRPAYIFASLQGHLAAARITQYDIHNGRAQQGHDAGHLSRGDARASRGSGRV